MGELPNRIERNTGWRSLVNPPPAHKVEETVHALQPTNIQPGEAYLDQNGWPHIARTGREIWTTSAEAQRKGAEPITRKP